MGWAKFVGRVSEYLHSIDDKKTANRAKAGIIKLMADNSPWENVAQNSHTTAWNTERISPKNICFCFIWAAAGKKSAQEITLIKHI